ncbi:tetratricopeptide repeat protein [Novosphingobium jiangmenense]|uniref:DUF560 domain-containing protein n=1 Tax=Novosphingobium jiangmenense TaxID=2791981 RepID=A0ABS0HI11_9SPHN|nr:tetratricopeptide repeat protein [Novosphingobium jiangmenense]MBF9151611.1 DUF560 domain-containing protein [Novosphingobium jiangmenense]
MATKHLFLQAIACAMAVAAALPAPAFGQANEAETRYKALAEQERAKAGDPAFDYALGLAASDAGHYGEAIVALQRVLARQPDNAPARAELARAYALAGDIDTARAQFATVVDDPTIPDPVRQRFTGFVRQFDKQIKGGGSDLSGFAESSFGHDSNINSATQLTSITIPLFAALGPGTLGNNARAQKDEFYDLSGGISAVSAVSRTNRVFGSLLANFRDNLDSAAFDQASLTGTAGFAHTFANRDVASLSGQVQKYWLGHTGFRTAYGAIGQYTHMLSGGKALSASVQYTRFDYDRDPLRDADRFAVGLGLAARQFSINLIGGHEETRKQAGDAESNTFAGASAGAEIQIAPKVAVVGGIAFDLRRYDRADLLFMRKRHDERVDLTAAVKIAVLPRLFLQPKATWSRNWSNIALYDHERWTVQAGARFEF